MSRDPMAREPISRDRAVVRAYGRLVHLYPRQFREEYGADMVTVFRDQCRDESSGSALRRAVLDLALTIPNQHLEARMHRHSNALVPLIYFAIATAGFLIAVAGGTDPTPILLGLAVAMAAGTVGVIAWRRTRVNLGSLGGAWWKLLATAVVLVLAVIVAAGLGVEAWYLAMLTLLVAFVLAVVGLGLGIAQLLDRRRPKGPPLSLPSDAG